MMPQFRSRSQHKRATKRRFAGSSLWIYRTPDKRLLCTQNSLGLDESQRAITRQQFSIQYLVEDILHDLTWRSALSEDLATARAAALDGGPTNPTSAGDHRQKQFQQQKLQS